MEYICLLTRFMTIYNCIRGDHLQQNILLSHIFSINLMLVVFNKMTLSNDQLLATSSTFTLNLLLARILNIYIETII